MTVSPVWSVTTPLMTFAWANDASSITQLSAIKRKNLVLFIMFVFVGYYAY